jgi:hypothetical protein
MSDTIKAAAKVKKARKISDAIVVGDEDQPRDEYGRWM